MEVIINGIKYIPETDKTVEVGGIAYSNIGNWLYNVRCNLTDKWVNHIKEGQPVNETPEERALYEKIICFDKYTKEFLGFEYDEGNYKFLEVKK